MGSGWGKTRQVLQIINVRLRFIFLMVAIGLVAGNWQTILNYYDRWTRPALAAGDPTTEYFCPMHPRVIRDVPGKCPICGMPLSKRAKSTAPTSMPEGVQAQIDLTPLKVTLGRVATTQVEYRLLGREVRTVGQADYDETRRAMITARIKGRLDKLVVNFTGQEVKAGDTLAEIYSPDLLVAQEELLLADKSARENPDKNSPLGIAAQATLTASRRKLILWGLPTTQIDKIIAKREVKDRLEIVAPMAGIVTEKNVLEGESVMDGQKLYTVADLKSVWMQAQIFESDLAGIVKGQAVEVVTRAYPNETFAGRIGFIAFTADPDTRTVRARIEIDNPDYKLKPGMFVEARIHIAVGGREPTSQPAVTMPAMAAPAHKVDTAKLAKAYLALSAIYFEDKTDAAAVDGLIAEARAVADHTPDAKPLVGAAESLKGKTLDAQREQFKAVSAAMIKFLGTHPPTGIDLFVTHCPMLNTDWLIDRKEVRNPYIDANGQRMPTCGDPPVPLPISPAGGTSQPDEGRFEYGYFCPIKPDKLFDAPEHCPIDKFPLHYVKAERVLAVPESAVVDTGERQVVFRERSAGSFDMVEVKVGPRAGEFYPVESGLKLGDKVVTQGAFAVDAENRLNPAAAAQFFGATGSPKAETPGHAGH